MSAKSSSCGALRCVARTRLTPSTRLGLEPLPVGRKLCGPSRGTAGTARLFFDPRWRPRLDELGVKRPPSVLGHAMRAMGIGNQIWHERKAVRVRLDAGRNRAPSHGALYDQYAHMRARPLISPTNIEQTNSFHSKANMCAFPQIPQLRLATSFDNAVGEASSKNEVPNEAGNDGLRDPAHERNLFGRRPNRCNSARDCGAS